MWHHPKYYEELRRIRKLHEAGSQDQAPSDKQQAVSSKRQATSDKQQAATNCRSDDMTQEA